MAKIIIFFVLFVLSVTAIENAKSSENRWSEWTKWKDHCDTDRTWRRQINCINDKMSCDTYEEAQHCNKEYKSARLPHCQFVLLTLQSELLTNQAHKNVGQRLKECDQKPNCIGVYKDGNEARWRTLVSPDVPKNRQFYEENCSNQSVKTVNQIYIHQSRLNKILFCNSKFYTAVGLPKTNVRYHFSPEAVNRTDAIARCENQGGKLAEIESLEELRKIHDIMSKKPAYHVGAETSATTKKGIKDRNQWYWRYSRLPANQKWLWEVKQPNAPGNFSHLSEDTNLLKNGDSMEEDLLFVCECQNPLIEYLD